MVDGGSTHKISVIFSLHFPTKRFDFVLCNLIHFHSWKGNLIFFMPVSFHTILLKTIVLYYALRCTVIKELLGKLSKYMSIVCIASRKEIKTTER